MAAGGSTTSNKKPSSGREVGAAAVPATATAGCVLRLSRAERGANQRTPPENKIDKIDKIRSASALQPAAAARRSQVHSSARPARARPGCACGHSSAPPTATRPRLYAERVNGEVLMSRDDRVFKRLPPLPNTPRRGRPVHTPVKVRVRGTGTRFRTDSFSKNHGDWRCTVICGE